MSELANVTLVINGQTYTLQLEPRRTLLDTIREECGLTGTHMGCEHGVCGACTVLLDGDPIRACLMFAVQAQGSAIRTVEGLADGETLPLQRAFMAHHGLQCGYCGTDAVWYDPGTNAYYIPGNNGSDTTRFF